jgi:hypothetical protein
LTHFNPDLFETKKGKKRKKKKRRIVRMAPWNIHRRDMLLFLASRRFFMVPIMRTWELSCEFIFDVFDFGVFFVAKFPVHRVPRFGG